MLSNKLALVSGAASGIGLAVSKALAAEGATVCLLDIQIESLKSVINDLKSEHNNVALNHSFYECDVSNGEKVETTFNEIMNKYKKPPTIVINCAGVLVMKLFVDTNEAEYDRVMNINVKGTFLVSNMAVKKLIETYEAHDLSNEATYASIINISSVSCRNAMKYVSVYASSKAAVDCMSRCMARELGKYKIRCNAILPGAVKTPMVMKGNNEEEKGSKIISLGRFAEANEVADLCLYLASDKSSYITGASIEISGGMHF